MEEIDLEVGRPVVQKVLKLMEFRNTYPAFDGSFEMMECPDYQIHIVRTSGEYRAELFADFQTKEISIKYLEDGILKEFGV
jgi:sucrose phosphorylase